jgi:cell division septal protein FtsQ
LGNEINTLKIPLAKNWRCRYVGAMLTRSLRIFVVFFCPILFVSALSAQKYVPKKISFSGYTAATEAELLAASGLQPGVAIGQPDIQAAAQKLND